MPLRVRRFGNIRNSFLALKRSTGGDSRGPENVIVHCTLQILSESQLVAVGKK